MLVNVVINEALMQCEKINSDGIWNPKLESEFNKFLFVFIRFSIKQLNN